MNAERAYSVQDARDLFARWENGDANEGELAGGLHALLDALSSPPADDVREALIRELHSDYPTPIPALNQLYEDHADRFLSRFEVRPCGTVTDAKRQAVADAIDNAAVITPRNEFLGGSTIANILEVADAALEAAREARS